MRMEANVSAFLENGINHFVRDKNRQEGDRVLADVVFMYLRNNAIVPPVRSYLVLHSRSFP